MSHRARKRFGQNFLKDKSVVERIVDAVGPADDTPVVEIGPGLAALTLPLLERHRQLHVIELDRDLVARLQERDLTGLSIEQADALTVDYSALARSLGQDTDKPRLRLVGNLPYNIGTPLLIKLARQHTAIQSLHVMLQREVIDRLAAVPGSKHWGRLSVMVNSVFTATRLFDVPPQCFDPEPKVQSAVARLLPVAHPPDDEELDALETATRMAFANRRKTLRNNFRGILDEAELESAGIDPGSRAETLELDQFKQLASHLPHTRRSGSSEC